MAGKPVEVSTPLLENILNQPRALRQVADRQTGEGLSDLRRAADLLRSRKRIILTGMGASYFACLPFQYSLVERGLPALAIESGELLHFLNPLVTADTVVLLVSRSGESAEIIKLLSDLRARGAAIIGIVNVPDSTLGREADVSIVMGSPADQMVAIQSYIATLTVLCMMTAAVNNNCEHAKADLNQTIDLLESWIPECVTASNKWGNFLSKSTPLYLLARGASLGTVHEGVLLLHETAKTGAIGMSVPQFRHGPVEVVDSNFRAVVIGTNPATAAFDLALAKDTARMGGDIRWIGPLHEDGGVTPLHAWPAGMPLRFAQIAEVIPLQLIAYRTAELRGVTPGEFRWATLVTDSEAGFSVLDANGATQVRQNI
jgi:glutamine---fructose-6-phosphate transaminase (isomerizing)